MASNSSRGASREILQTELLRLFSLSKDFANITVREGEHFREVFRLERGSVAQKGNFHDLSP